MSADRVKICGKTPPKVLARRRTLGMFGGSRPAGKGETHSELDEVIVGWRTSSHDPANRSPATIGSPAGLSD
jgi:hypothetical protein